MLYGKKENFTHILGMWVKQNRLMEKF